MFSIDRRLIGAFFAGQVVMLGLVALLRAAPVHAQFDAYRSGQFQKLIVKDPVSLQQVQIVCDPAAAGPSFAFFDRTGDNRLQMSLDRDGVPEITMRDRAGKIVKLIKPGD